MKYLILLPLFWYTYFASAQLSYTQKQFAFDSILDVVYGVDTNYAGNIDTLIMDIYKPIGDANCLRPVMILVHGGAWIGGDKNESDLVYLSKNLAARGWVVANINYRLGTHKTSNYTMYALCNSSISQPCGYICDSAEVFRGNFRGMQDAKGAVRFMKARYDSDSTDLGNFYIAGESAGGFISMYTAFMDQESEKPAGCFQITDAPTPDSDLKNYSCVPNTLSLKRPDLGSIDGDLNLGKFDAYVKGVGNWFGGLFSLDIINQKKDTPDIYLFHQGSDVVVNYDFGTLLGRISWECYAQTNICQQYYFYPFAYGGLGLNTYFKGLGNQTPRYQADIVPNYSYMNNCFSNGHAPDQIETRLQNMVDFFAPTIEATGNLQGNNCWSTGILNTLNPLQITVFPNPSSGLVNIQFNQTPLPCNIEVHTIFGQLVWKGQNQHVIDLSELKQGIYFISVQTENQEKVVKFMKQN